MVGCWFIICCCFCCRDFKEEKNFLVLFLLLMLIEKEWDYIKMVVKDLGLRVEIKEVWREGIVLCMLVLILWGFVFYL